MTIDVADLIARILAQPDARDLARRHGIDPRAMIEELFYSPLPNVGQVRSFLRELGYDPRPLRETLVDAHEFWMGGKQAA